MRYKLLGKSGLRVSELCLGTMTFGEDWGWGASKQESRKMFDSFADRGGNFLDTANRYTEGTSEKLVGDFIKSNRDHFVLATKYTLFDRQDDVNFCGNHRKNMIRSLEASLKRLNTDFIDLFWLHAWDFTTPVEEIMRGLDDLVSAGKVHYIGISDTPAWIVSQANTMAELRGWSRFIALQIRYSLIDRTPERELLPMARAMDMAITPWSVLGAGVLSGKYNKDSSSTGRAAQGAAQDQGNLEIAQQAMTVAGEIGCSTSQVALNWVRQKYALMIPLVGARNTEQLEDNLGCLDHGLTTQQMNRLDEASKTDLGFPHDFLELDTIKEVVFGGTQDHIDNHRSLQ